MIEPAGPGLLSALHGALRDRAFDRFDAAFTHIGIDGLEVRTQRQNCGDPRKATAPLVLAAAFAAGPFAKEQQGADGREEQRHATDTLSTPLGDARPPLGLFVAQASALVDGQRRLARTDSSDQP